MRAPRASRSPDTGRLNLPLLVPALGFAVALPFLVDTFTAYGLTIALSYVILLIGLVILTGASGQFSLGHGAFYAIGAYTTGALMHHYGISAYLTLPAAAAVCFVIGFLFGMVAARLGFLYLALATYGLAVVTPPVLKSRYLEDITLGVQGIYFTRPAAPEFIGLHIDRWWYFVALAIALFGSWLAWNLLRGRIGRAVRALRDHEIAALGMGIPVARYKAIIFAISAAFAGVGGAIGGLAADYIAPDNFRFAFSLQFVAALVIGGMRFVAGAWIGGIALILLPATAARIDPDLIGAIYGALLIGLILIAPYGIAGGFADLRERLRARRG